MRAWIPLLLGLLGFGAPLAAQELVIPNAASITEQSGSNFLPLSTFFAPSIRYQQVYLATQFPAPVTIYAISFRPDEVATVTAQSLDLEIWLSTTPIAPDALSQSFALNIGLDAKLVFDQTIALSTAVTPNGVTPKDFDIVIPLQTPFSYDPVQGNLLLDLRNRTETISFIVDAAEMSGDGVSRVFTNAALTTTSADTPTGLVDSLGVVTRFTLPEPTGAHAAVAAGLALVARLRALQPSRSARTSFGPGRKRPFFAHSIASSIDSDSIR